MIRGTATFLLAVGVPLALAAAVVSILATPAAVRMEYERPGFPPSVGMSHEQRAELAVVSTRYVVGNATTAELEALRRPLPDGGDARDALYAADEVEHLRDVRVRITWLRRAGLLAGLALAAAWLVPAWRPTAARASVWGGGMTVGLIALLGAGIAVAWSWLFTTFHVLLFPEGTWQFAADSGLIRLFPDVFWSDAAVALVGGVALGGLGIALIGRAHARRRFVPTRRRRR